MNWRPISEYVKPEKSDGEQLFLCDGDQYYVGFWESNFKKFVTDEYAQIYPDFFMVPEPPSDE